MVKKNSAKKAKRTTLRKKSSSSVAFKFSHPLVIIGIAFLLFLTTIKIQTTQSLTVNPKNVLSENVENEEQKKEDEILAEAEKQTEEQLKQQEEKQREAVKTTNSNTSGPSDSSGESIRSKTEIVTPNGLKLKKELDEDKQETEIETAEGIKIKTKIEDDGTSKIEVKNGTVKLKYKVENGQVLLKAENELGEEVGLEEKELEELTHKVDAELEQENIKLHITTDNKLAVTKNQIAALTDYPLSIDIETKQLIVTTPFGQKVVTVLPDEAVQNLLAADIINKLDTSLIDTATQVQLGKLTGAVKLEIRNDEVVYKVSGVKTHRVFGFIPINSSITAFVSAGTGEAIAKQQSILTNIIDLLSP